MRIGELARHTGTAIETIRFYEREGLLPTPARSGNNYRSYQATHAERLAFIRQCRQLDMALDEIRTLLSLRDGPAEDCAGVDAVLDEHIEHVSRRLRELRALERELKALRERCATPSTLARCGILKALDEELPEAGRPRLHVPGTH